MKKSLLGLIRMPLIYTGVSLALISGCNQIIHNKISDKGNHIVKSKGIFGKVEYFRKPSGKVVIDYFPCTGPRGYDVKVKAIDSDLDNQVDFIFTRKKNYLREEDYQDNKEIFREWDSILKNLELKRFSYLSQNSQ